MHASLSVDKKENQRLSGLVAQQNGEKVKNLLTNATNWDGDLNNINKQIQIFCEHLEVSIDDVRHINAKAHSDGRTKCAKSDLKVTLELKNKSKLTKQGSLKSTFAETQVAVHSIDTLIDYLSKVSIKTPDNVKEFLTNFTNSVNGYTNKPNFIHSESIRRERFTIDEINSFNPQLFADTATFFEQYATEFLNFIISIGGEVSKEKYATTLIFCNKDLKNLMLIDIKKLISYSVKISKENNTFCYSHKPNKNGITRFSLYNGLIKVQMKGSGEGAAYHNIQFKISGGFIKKLKEQGVLDAV